MSFPPCISSLNSCRLYSVTGGLSDPVLREFCSQFAGVPLLWGQFPERLHRDVYLVFHGQKPLEASQRSLPHVLHSRQDGTAGKSAARGRDGADHVTGTDSDEVLQGVPDLTVLARQRTIVDRKVSQRMRKKRRNAVRDRKGFTLQNSGEVLCCTLKHLVGLLFVSVTSKWLCMRPLSATKF